jgi:hypothetical protein
MERKVSPSDLLTQQHLQIIENNANYPSLQRDTGTELSVLLVP